MENSLKSTSAASFSRGVKKLVNQQMQLFLVTHDLCRRKFAARKSSFVERASLPFFVSRQMLVLYKKFSILLQLLSLAGDVSLEKNHGPGQQEKSIRTQGTVLKN